MCLQHSKTSKSEKNTVWLNITKKNNVEQINKRLNNVLIRFIESKPLSSASFQPKQNDRVV